MLDMFNVLEEAMSSTTLCGGVMVPDTIFNLVSTVIKAIKIVVPILLIIWGMLDFAKSVVAKKEEDIKKYQKSFISRLISAVLVFLVITIVQLAVNLVSGVEKQSNVEGQTTGDIWSCSKKFINGVDEKEKAKDEEKNTQDNTDQNSDN